MSGSPQLTHSHLEQVHDMMADAMRESTGSDSQTDSDGQYTLHLEHRKLSALGLHLAQKAVSTWVVLIESSKHWGCTWNRK